MDTSDVLVVGGGPAGSSCAWRLVRAGLRTTVVDAAAFPRDKVCAGWITPPVLEELALDVDDYRRGRTFQPILGFRVGAIGRASATAVAYSRPISFGIRRCEFDAYLLRRSAAHVVEGEPVRTVERRGGVWILNGRYQAPWLVGAGGHFCPVARHLNPSPRRVQIVAAQEVELSTDAAFDPVSPTRPELYFSRDFRGYGWVFRKEGVVNVGFGSLERATVARSVAAFVAFLQKEGRIARGHRAWPWRGHAYRLYEPAPTRILEGDGTLLVGDAAGLAYPESGEGIRPAIESGLLAASSILAGGGYGAQLRQRLGGAEAPSRSLRPRLPPGLVSAVGCELIRFPWFVRRVVLDRWFLHAGEDALAS